ncbi:MAG TPA: protein translocase subunit SecD [Myxococcota bacterium]|nr:protein translocase subunit SecD [Myxococcota bacterium]
MNKRNLWKPLLTLGVTLLAILYVLPTLLPADTLPKWYPFQKRMSLGLDLQGGLELRYTVDYKKAISDNLLRIRDSVVDAVVDELARKDGKDPEQLTNEEREALMARFKAERTDFDTLRLTFVDKEDVKVVTVGLIDDLRTDLVRQIPTGNQVVLNLNKKRVTQIREEVVEQTLDVIRKRVEAFGLVEPDVRKNGDTDIDIQMPGVRGDEVEAVRARIGQTAQLAFRIVNRSPEAVEFFNKNSGKLAEFQSRFPEKGALLSLDRDGSTGQWILRAAAGTQHGAGDTLAKNAIYSFIKTLSIPDEHMIGLELEEVREGGRITERYYRTHYLFSKAGVTGDHLTRSMVLFEQQGEPYVSLEFDATGARQFEKVTEENTGEYMAIMLDDEVSSAPIINEKIGGGRAKISMGGNRPRQEILNEAQALVTVLTHGAYKAPVHKIHDYEVGPSLGQDTIDSGILSLVVGVALVFLFMLVYYRGSGLIAVAGLALNVLFTVAILIGFNAALTMPGMAGIVLTVGMAVDANVLISERIRDEIRLGKGPRASMEAGYKNAFSAILDSNLTTALTGIILLNYSSGAVYGFAVTLLIGIVVTFVTQVFITRLIYDWYIDRFRPNHLSIGI